MLSWPRRPTTDGRRPFPSQVNAVVAAAMTPGANDDVSPSTLHRAGQIRERNPPGQRAPGRHMVPRRRSVLGPRLPPPSQGRHRGCHSARHAGGLLSAGQGQQHRGLQACESQHRVHACQQPEEDWQYVRDGHPLRIRIRIRVRSASASSSASTHRPTNQPTRISPGSRARWATTT